MVQDLKRARTFLSYKGFQWEPVTEDGGPEARSADFLAAQDGVIRLCGTVISMGRETHPGGVSERIAFHGDETEALRDQLARRLNRYAQRMVAGAMAPDLPRIAIIANHAPALRFEDLPAILEAVAGEDLSQIGLFVWFDDLRPDQMLLQRSDPGGYRRMAAWFCAE